MWSGIFGGEQTLEGKRHLIYQSGLAFTGLTADQQAGLASILERLAQREGLTDAPQSR